MTERHLADAGMRPSVYTETTPPGYLAARGSRDLIVAAHQRITQDGWDKRLQIVHLPVGLG